MLQSNIYKSTTQIQLAIFFVFFRDEKNLQKSRYRDVIPGELTRVKLQPDIDDKNDFINANYVSGYNNQEKAYIFTQGKS
jgi:protein tyrosine phosphatase